MESIRPKINTQIFSWALNRMGIMLEEAQKRFPYIEQWQNGCKAATVNQLKDFSKKYNFPFGYFFLNELPNENKNPIPFFRSCNEIQAEQNLNVIDTVKILTERQAWLSDYFKDNGANKNPIIGTLKNEKNIKTIINSITDYLGLSKDWNIKLKTPQTTLKYLTDLLEERNIIVSFNSVVKNNTRRSIPVQLCRGFCLVDDYTPFIFVNSADSKKAQIFTVLHELAHIFISFSAGYGEFGLDEIEDSREALCDKIARTILVPEDLLIQYNKRYSNEELSDLFKASEIVILRRKLECNLINKNQFFTSYNNLSPYKKQGSGKGNFYDTAEKRIGRKVLQSLYTAMLERYITPMDAYYLAGLKGDTFNHLMNVAGLI